ncbi:MAG: hypothetical protein AB7N80_08600 [Bdellovibrionales bacterium]
MGTVLLFQNCSGFTGLEQGSFEGSSSGTFAAPGITFSATPEIINSAVVTLSFDVEMPPGSLIKSITCQLGDSAPIDCGTKTASFANLTDGDYVLKVIAENTQGTKSEAVKSFRKDATAPVVLVSSAPPDFTNQQTFAISFSVTDNLSGVQAVECSYDNAAFGPCTSATSSSMTLNAGAHKFQLRAIDRGGNVSVVYNRDWMIDLSTPTVVINDPRPAAATNADSATFNFSGVGIVAYECQLDAGAIEACDTGKAYTALASAQHTFRVRGRNAAGTLSAFAQYMWTIDRTAPSVPVLVADVPAAPNATAIRNASISFSANDGAGTGIAGFVCAVDGSATFAACTSPRAFTNLAEGNHSLRVKARDNAGNESAEGAFSWVVDSVLPTLAFVNPPASSTSTSAVIQFNAADAGSGLASVQCSLNNAAFANCTSPVNLSGLAVQAHNFRVRATDRAGNIQNVAHNWSVMPVVAPPPAEWVVPTISLAAGSGSTFNLVDTLPANVVRNGVFSVDPTGAALPAGMTLAANGVLSVGTAAVGDTNGVIFSYTEP